MKHIEGCNCGECLKFVDEYINSQEYKERNLLFEIEKIVLNDDIEFEDKKKKKKGTSVPYFPETEKQKTYKRWVTKFNDNTCQFCKNLNNQEVGYFEKFKELKYEFVAPPAHKGCVCTVEKFKK